MTADEIAERLGARRNGSGWTALCPAHPDKNPSLSISEGNHGGVLLLCRAGCDTSAVVAAGGMTFADLAPPETAKPKPRVVARYTYTDENGTPIRQVERWEPGRDGKAKSFSQSRYEGGEWVPGVKGVRNVLYRLPEVIAAVTEGVTVLVCEGEKDADAGVAAGFCATTNVSGAPNWHLVAEHAREVLAGAHVVVVADKDTAGYKRAWEVTTGLADVAASIITVEPVSGNDLADHLAAGKTVAELLEIGQGPIDNTTPASTTGEDLEDLSSFDPIDLGPAWRGEKIRPAAEVFQRSDGLALLPPGINYLFGDSGDGKSLVALLAVAAEIRLGHPAVWVTYEDANEELLVDRARMLGVTEREKDLIKFITPDLGLTHGAAKLADLAVQLGARLFVLDSVGEAMAVGGQNEDADVDVGPWFRQTARLIHNQVPSLAILPIDHSTKAKDNALFPSGSKRKRAVVTGRSYLLNVSKSLGIGMVGYVQLVVAKDRGGTFARGDIAAEIMLDATVSPYEWSITPARDGNTTFQPKVKRRNAQDRVLEVLARSTVPLTTAEVHRIANAPDGRREGEGELSAKTVKNALTEASKKTGVQMTEVEQDGSGQFFPAKWVATGPDQDRSNP